MRFIRALFIGFLCLLLNVSVLVFGASYTVMSALSPSLVMTVVKEAGDTKQVVAELTKYVALYATDDSELQEAIGEIAQEVLTPETIRSLVDQYLDGAKRFVASGGEDRSATLDLKGLKASILSAVKKSHPDYLSYVQEALSEVPDVVPLSSAFPGAEAVREIAVPYRIASNLPVLSLVAAGASVLLLLLVAGWRSGLRITGYSLVISGVLALAAGFVVSGPVAARIMESIPKEALPADLPIKADTKALASSVLGFVTDRLKMVGGATLALGLALCLVPKGKPQASEQPKQA